MRLKRETGPLPVTPALESAHKGDTVNTFKRQGGVFVGFPEQTVATFK